MEKYNFVLENKRGEKYVLIQEVLKMSNIPEYVLDSLEVYNIYINNGDDKLNIKCFLLSDIEKLENDDVEIWDDEFEDEDMEMSPEELEEDETIMKIVEERDKNDNGNRYTLEEVVKTLSNLYGIH